MANELPFARMCFLPALPAAMVLGRQLAASAPAGAEPRGENTELDRNWDARAPQLIPDCLLPLILGVRASNCRCCAFFIQARVASRLCLSIGIFTAPIMETTNSLSTQDLQEDYPRLTNGLHLSGLITAY